MSEKNKQEKKAIVGAILFGLVVVFIGVITWLLTHKTEIYTSEGSIDTDASSLDCVASHPTDAFFVSSVAQSFEHRLKLIFKGEVVSDISYVFEGTYNSDSIAETAMAEMHAQYNKYMGKYGVSAENYNPVFTSVKAKANISIYVERAKLNNVIARIIFISDDEFRKIDEYKPEDFKKNYENRGFYCTNHE